jgi:FtsH-binding integral membrane protein
MAWGAQSARPPKTGRHTFRLFANKNCHASHTTSMESVDRFVRPLMENSAVPEHARAHLLKVYTALTCTIVSAAAGAAMDFRLQIGGVLTGLLGAFGMMYLWSSRHKMAEHSSFSLLLLVGFLYGTSLGPLLQFVAMVDASLILTALVGTAAVFVCFSASALLAKRYTFIALGGLLSSGISLLLLLSFFSLFARTEALLVAQLYLGLFIFAGYVLFDTQLILERAVNGQGDYLRDAGELFIDFFQLFVRILIILTRNSDKKKRRD